MVGMNLLSLWGQLATVENHTFLTAPLQPGATVIDAGANVGGFAAEIVTRYGCTVHAFEPHPDHFARIPAGERIVKHQAAVAGTEGVRRLQFSDNPQGSRLDASGLSGVEVPTRNLETYAAGLANIVLIKLDIEGTEVEVLDSLSESFLARVGQFTIEFHDFAGYLTTDAVRTAIARMEAKGFAAFKFSRKSER